MMETLSCRNMAGTKKMLLETPVEIDTSVPINLMFSEGKEKQKS